MDIRSCFGIALTALAAAGFMGIAAVCKADAGTIKREITKRDSQGRTKVMVVRAETGSCMAEAVYVEKLQPRIYVLLIAGSNLQNLGFLQINDGTEQGLSDDVLTRNFDKAIQEHCLPLIVRGSHSV